MSAIVHPKDDSDHEHPNVTSTETFLPNAQTAIEQNRTANSDGTHVSTGPPAPHIIISAGLHDTLYAIGEAVHREAAYYVVEEATYVSQPQVIAPALTAPHTTINWTLHTMSRKGFVGVRRKIVHDAANAAHYGATLDACLRRLVDG